jgi:hypothetical protein
MAIALIVRMLLDVARMKIISHKDAPGTASHRKFVLLGTPPHMSRSPIDTQQHQRRLPRQGPSLGVWFLLPDISIAILRCGDDAVRVWGPVDRSNDLVVLDNLVSGGRFSVRSIAYLSKSIRDGPLVATTR